MAGLLAFGFATSRASAAEPENNGFGLGGNPFIASNGGSSSQLQSDPYGPQMPYMLGVNQTGMFAKDTTFYGLLDPYLGHNISSGSAGLTGDIGPYGPLTFAGPTVIDTSVGSGAPSFSLEGITLPDSTASYFGGTDWIPTPTFGNDFGGIGFDFGSLFSPVILDLDGDGVDITPVTGSNQFFDMAGSGYKQRTAWAGAGDAVLALDADGDGKITERNEVIFTDWDPTAESDMDALSHVFDTNHNGKLDAGDAKFGSFRLMVSNADGTTSLKTLAQAGITAIDLTADKTQRVMEDGSSIDGQTSFTRSNGKTGIAATVSLAAEDGAGAVKTTTTNASGVVTVDNKLYDMGGQLVSESKLVTSADRKTRTLSFDDDGDGVVDRSRTTVITDNANGIHVETATDRAYGIVLGKVTTTTSADRATVTILRDDDGDGKSDQKEVDATGSDGSSSVTIQNLNEDASVINTVQRTVSADGLTATTTTDLDNANGADLTTTDATVVANDGTRTRTVSETNNDGSLRDRSVTVTSANGATRTENIDADGDKAVDLTRVSSTTVRASDGTIIMVETEKNGDGTTRDVHRTEVTASGLSRAETWDINGDGMVDAIHKEGNSIDANGNRTLVTTELTGGGTVLSRTTTVKGPDGITRTTSVDADGNGRNDSVDQVSVASSGEVTETLSNYRPDGTLMNGVVTTTSADGLTKTIKSDRDGNGTVETRTVLQTSYYQNGGSGVATSRFTSYGALIDQSLVMTSANGLYTVTEIDVDGVSGWDFVTNSSTVVGSDGVRTTTQTTRGADGSKTADGHLLDDGTLQSKVVTTLSADRNVTTITTDANGDGATDSVETITKGANGVVSDVVTRYDRQGNQYLITTSRASATGLTKVVHTNVDASGGDDRHDTDTTLLLADGRRMETVTSAYADGTTRSSTRTQLSGDGLHTVVQTDVDGDGKFDSGRISDTVLNANGSRTTTVTRKAGGKSGTTTVIGSTVTTVSDDGLSTTVVSDLDGNSLVADSTDLTTTDVKTLNADGKGGTSETLTNLNNKGGTIDKTTTAISADGKATAITTDIDGNGSRDESRTINVQANGDVVDTTVAYDAAGTVIQTTTVTTSADGLSTTRVLNVGSDTTADETQKRTLGYNADGSVTEVVTDANADDNIQPGSKGMQSRIETTTSANGLHKTISVTGSSEGFDINHIADDVIKIGADGGRTETRTITTAGANDTRQLLNTKKITDSAHGLKHTEELVSGVVGNYRITDETVVNGDGSTTRTYTDMQANSPVIFEYEITRTSANGRSITVEHDTDRDGRSDEFKATTIGVDQSRTDEIRTTTGSGGLLSRSVKTTSADGRTQTIAFDTDGDGVVDVKQTQVSVINYDGSTTQTRSDYNGKGALRDRITTTTSANDYRITGNIDLDGDGATDETFSNQTVLETSGSKTQTIQTKYADGSTKNKTVIQTSANGRHVVTSEDLNGDGKNDVVTTDDVASSGVRTIGVRYYDAAGKMVSSDTTTTSADGRLSTRSRDFDGNGTQDALEVESHLADGNGSYDIGAQDATSNGILYEANHFIDENGADHIYMAQRNQYRRTLYDPAVNAIAWVQTVRQTADKHAKLDRLYDVMLDRASTAAEEISITYKDPDVVITPVLNSNEFKQRYGTLTNAQFVEQMYENAYGRSAKASELSNWLTQLSTNKTTRAGVVMALARSAEHLTVGNVHTVTSSSRNVSGQFTLEHTLDKMVAADTVDRVYSTGLGRHGADAGAAAAANGILSGADTEAAIAGRIVASSEFANRYGTLNDGGFVNQMFQNALGRAPTSAELSSWTGLLGSGAVSRGDLVVGLADDLDYKGVATSSTASRTSSRMSSAAAPSSVNAQQASSFNRMVQAMSTMSEHPHAASTSTFATAQTTQEHQLAASHH